MKLNWKQWTAIGLTSAAVITEIVLCFVQPWSAVWGGLLFVGGAITGYLAKKNNIVNDAKTEE